MNISFVIRVLLVVAAFAIPFLEPELYRQLSGSRPGYLIIVGIVFLGSMGFSLFGGCMRVFFSQRTDLLRPSLSAPLFLGRSPLQFFWFAGMLSLSAGVGAIVRHLAHSVSFEGVLLMAVGLGLVSGSVLTLRKMSGRFVKLEKQST